MKYVYTILLFLPLILSLSSSSERETGTYFRNHSKVPDLDNVITILHQIRYGAVAFYITSFDLPENNTMTLWSGQSLVKFTGREGFPRKLLPEEESIELPYRVEFPPFSSFAVSFIYVDGVNNKYDLSYDTCISPMRWVDGECVCLSSSESNVTWNEDQCVCSINRELVKDTCKCKEYFVEVEGICSCLHPREIVGDRCQCKQDYNIELLGNNSCTSFEQLVLRGNVGDIELDHPSTIVSYINTAGSLKESVSYYQLYIDGDIRIQFNGFGIWADEILILPGSTLTIILSDEDLEKEFYSHYPLESPRNNFRGRFESASFEAASGNSCDFSANYLVDDNVIYVDVTGCAQPSSSAETEQLINNETAIEGPAGTLIGITLLILFIILVLISIAYYLNRNQTPKTPQTQVITIPTEPTQPSLYPEPHEPETRHEIPTPQTPIQRTHEFF